MTNTTRQVLAKFFKVHPGYLVDDPEGYHVELQSDARALEDKLDLWLISGAERFRRDRELRQALLGVSRHSDSRRCLLLLNAVIETPGLVDRLFDVLHSPEDNGRGLRPASTPAAPSAPQAHTRRTGLARRAGRSREATQ
jgi:hypothetical protein